MEGKIIGPAIGFALFAVLVGMSETTAASLFIDFLALLAGVFACIGVLLHRRRV